MKYDYSAAVRVACKALKLPLPVAEYKFAAHLGRKFSTDFCWPDRMVMLEVEGGTWAAGRHSRGEADHEKYNLAASLGYRLFRTTPQKVGNLALYKLIKQVL